VTPTQTWAQPLFERVWNHLLTQQERASTNEQSCAYRGYEGRKCGVGCLIPNELYRPEMEGLSVTHLLAEYPDLSLLIRGGGHPGVDYYAQTELLIQFQRIHDVYASRAWESQLRLTAETYGLTCPPVPTRSSPSETGSAPAEPGA
jgi:hypothetical protein